METMAFCTVLPMQEETLLPETGGMIEIDFQGPNQGAIQLWGGLALGQMLAENIGCLTETTDQNAWDAWQEICNVVCGLVLPCISHSDHDVFDISVPRVVRNTPISSWEEFVAQPHTQVFDVEGYALAARLIMEPRG
jgi:CheY-specific phosphatase CheX